MTDPFDMPSQDQAGDRQEPNYDYWQDALDGRFDLMINQNSPQPGFYRMKDGRAVAIWVDTDDHETLRMMVGQGQLLPSRDFEDAWTRCCTRPVTEAQYDAWIETGVWHDVDEDMLETLGDNIRDASDPETLKEMIDRLTAAAEKYKKLNDDNQVAKAASLRNRLLELKGRADKLRVELKAPILDAGRRVDATWQPLVKSAEDGANRLRRSMEAYETAKIVAARQAVEIAPEPLKAQVKSGYGRAASVRSRQVVTEITDIDVLFSVMKDSSELRGLLLKLAQYRVDKGFLVPGVRVEEQAVVA